MGNEEILKELLKSTIEMQSSMKEMQSSMKVMQSSIKVMQADVKEVKNDVVKLNNKVTKLEGKVNNLEEKTTRIDKSVMVLEHEYTKKIDVIYENTVSFMNANYKNRNDIEKLDKRVEKLECIIHIN